MAFGLFRRRPPEPAAAAVEPQAVKPAVAIDPAPASDSDSASEILELLELELGAMIRQLERAAGSVAGGAEATAATLSTIRQRTDALTGRASAAQSTANTFSQAAGKFTQSATCRRRFTSAAGIGAHSAWVSAVLSRGTPIEAGTPAVMLL
jgi:methyl-accepting chemotaxis protein